MRTRTRPLFAVAMLCPLLGLASVSCEQGREATRAADEDRGPEGTYATDAEAMRSAIKEWLSPTRLPPGVSAEQLEAIIEENTEAQMAMRSMELVLETGGAFVFTLSLNGEPSMSRGTWSLDGSALTLLTTQVDGVEQSTPDELVAEYANGRITMREKVEYPVVFQRK